jgi:hypothetical protein
MFPRLTGQVNGFSHPVPSLGPDGRAPQDPRSWMEIKVKRGMKGFSIVSRNAE